MRATVLSTRGRVGKQAILDSELVEIAGLCLRYIARKILVFVRTQRDLRWISFELGIATHPNSDLRGGSRPNPKMRTAALLYLSANRHASIVFHWGVQQFVRRPKTGFLPRAMTVENELPIRNQ